MNNFVIVASYPVSLVGFRGELIRNLGLKGFKVHCVGPKTTQALVDRLQDEFGATYWEVPMDRTGISAVSDLKLVVRLVQVIRSLKPVGVLGYTIKPVVYGSIAAKIAGCRASYSLITGLGVLYSGDGLKLRLLRYVGDLLYGVSLRLSRVVFFQNPDDARMFRSRGLVPKRARVEVLNGSGVDIERFYPSAPPVRPVVFTLIGRLIRTKGVFEFVEAAKIMVRRGYSARFRLVGKPEPGHIDGFDDLEIAKIGEIEELEVVGYTDDVRPLLRSTSVYVLPSYREGLPRSTIEAMSIGRPVITTDVPGCRETVVDGENGFLVALKDSNDLAAKMIRFVESPELISKMGKESRRLAVSRFDVKKVNEQMLAAMDI